MSGAVSTQVISTPCPRPGNPGSSPIIPGCSPPLTEVRPRPSVMMRLVEFFESFFQILLHHHSDENSLRCCYRSRLKIMLVHEFSHLRNRNIWPEGGRPRFHDRFKRSIAGPPQAAI